MGNQQSNSFTCIVCAHKVTLCLHLKPKTKPIQKTKFMQAIRIADFIVFPKHDSLVTNPRGIKDLQAIRIICFVLTILFFFVFVFFISSTTKFIPSAVRRFRSHSGFKEKLKQNTHCTQIHQNKMWYSNVPIGAHENCDKTAPTALCSVSDMRTFLCEQVGRLVANEVFKFN